MDTGTPNLTTTRWAGSALLVTAVIGIAAKIAGIIVAPGSRGVLSGRGVNLVETTSGAFAYVLTALLIALVCGASFELARARDVNGAARGGVVAVSGLVVALASPAVVERLGTLPSLALAVITSVVALVAGITVLRAPHTRAIGGILALLAISGLLRIVAWEASAISFERASLAIHQVARGFSTAAVSAQAFAALLAAAWIGTRSKWRGRILANLAILVAFAVTWLAASSSESPSAVVAMLRETLPAQAGVPSPFLIGSVSAFLVPVSILLAAVALLERGEAPALVAAMALALLSYGSFDVPLHALLVTASAQWALLAMAEGSRSLAIRGPATDIG